MPMRTLISAAALTLAATVLPVATSAAAGAPTITAANGVLYAGCNDYSYSFNLDLPSDTYSWSATFETFAPDGTSEWEDYTGGTSSRDDVGSDKAYICSSAGAGTFTIRATVKYSGAEESGRSSFAKQFTLRQALSKTKAYQGSKAVKNKSFVLFTRVTDERPNGYFPTANARVEVQKRVNGQWKSLGYSFTDSNGEYRTKEKFVGSKMYFRFVTRTNGYAASTSNTLTVKAAT